MFNNTLTVQIILNRNKQALKQLYKGSVKKPEGCKVLKGAKSLSTTLDFILQVLAAQHTHKLNSTDTTWVRPAFMQNFPFFHVDLHAGYESNQIPW